MNSTSQDGVRQQKKSSSIRAYIVLGAAGLLTAYAVVAMIRGGRWHVPPEAANWQNPAPFGSGTLGEAREIYKDKCTHCHGDSGKGDGPDARNYDPRPTDLTGAIAQEEPDGVLFYKLSEGKRPMPSFRRKLTEYQRWELVRLVRSFRAKQ